MTFIRQPADQSWMSPFKARYFKKWNHWLVHAPSRQPLADENVFDDTGDEWEWQDQAFEDSESEVNENEE